MVLAPEPGHPPVPGERLHRQHSEHSDDQSKTGGGRITSRREQDGRKDTEKTGIGEDHHTKREIKQRFAAGTLPEGAQDGEGRQGDRPAEDDPPSQSCLVLRIQL